MIRRLGRLKNTVNKGRHTTRSTYDLSFRTEVGRKSTTKCNFFCSKLYIRSGAGKSLAFLICSTTKKFFLDGLKKLGDERLEKTA
jgi:hypothetical protein